MKIYIIRHGETNANKDFILQGAIDWPLNEMGVKLAKITGQNLKDVKFDICFSSPQIRALNTAKIVLEESGNKDCEIILDSRIREYELGKWEGKSYIPSKKEVNLLRLILFKKNAFLVSPPKGEKAKDVVKRASSFLLDLVRKNYDNVLVSSHGGAIRAMLNVLYENKYSFWQSNPPPNCSINIVEVKEGEMKIIEEDKVYYDHKYLVNRYNIKDMFRK